MSSLKRHFTVVFEKDIKSGMLTPTRGLYISSTPSSAARKAVSKLCADNKKKKVKFSIREITQVSKKKTYGPYVGYMQKLEKPIELKGRIIRYKPITKLDKKSSKMKGGRIIGLGSEGVVLQPNINSRNMNKVSKLIKISSDEKIEELIRFERKLNEIDPKGKYHVPMINARKIESKNIDKITNLSTSNRSMLLSYEPNFKITYEYGGISIGDFINDRYNYDIYINKNFCIDMLFGVLNIFKGLYKFYENKINHYDFNFSNIVFLTQNPKKMRMIDWGIPKKIELNLLFKNNISTFVVEIFDCLLDKFKLLFPNNPKFIENLSDFLNIREFQQYLSSNTTDFSEDTFKIIKQQMIEKLEGMRPPTNDSQVNRYTNDSQVNRYTNDSQVNRYTNDSQVNRYTN
jgi:hypothetical protein